jgi:hypothetical protein
MSLYVILIPQLKAPQSIISPTNGIRVHGGVQQGGKVKKTAQGSHECYRRAGFLSPTWRRSKDVGELI